MIADGNGNITGGSEVLNDSSGNFCPGTIAGTYTGTGGMTIMFTPGAGEVGTCNSVTETASIVIVSDKRLSLVQTNSMMPVLGNLVKQQEPEGDEGD